MKAVLIVEEPQTVNILFGIFGNRGSLGAAPPEPRAVITQRRMHIFLIALVHAKQRDLRAIESDVNHESTRMDTNFVWRFPEKTDAELVAGIGEPGLYHHSPRSAIPATTISLTRPAT
jgi:hypothetical protein